VSYVIRGLDVQVRTADFCCGETALDTYICRYASQDVRRGVARVFVATPSDDAERLAGFFTLSAGSVLASTMPETLRAKLPRYPVPVALLGRLAVDKAFQGRGLGSILLADACRKVVVASHVLAVAGIVVEAKNIEAAAFYRHFGFVDLQGQARRLLLPSSVFSALGL
jgi:ribosomal protein S18 acetylase RimI-like enzyme